MVLLLSVLITLLLWHSQSLKISNYTADFSCLREVSSSSYKVVESYLQAFSFLLLCDFFRRITKRIIGQIYSRCILTVLPCGSQIFGILCVASSKTSGTFYTIGLNGFLILLDILSY